MIFWFDMNISINCILVKKNVYAVAKKKSPQYLNVIVMDNYKADLNRGIHKLSKHDLGSAVMYFSRALSSCPVSSSAELSRILYYMGIALKRLGLSNSAIRSWLVSLRVKKRKNTKKLLQRFSNSYGMAKQDSVEMDDWKAFYSIHLLRYLRGFRKSTLTSECERDCLKEIILAHWRKLVDSGILAGKTPEEKSEIFKGTEIDFPLFFYGQAEDPVIQVNFQAGRKLKAADTCFCGSGLPFCACCGRILGEDELTFGLF